MARSAGRERERNVCESCDLPYYADGDGCPYCEGVTTVDEPVESQESEGESGFVFGSAESGENTATGGDSDGNDSLVGRLKRALGL